jgi:FAD/FMN-containing dehydrogenase
VDGGLVVDLSGWRGVTVDAAAGEAVVGAGATLGDVDRATQEHGLAVPVGIVSQTGIAGLTLGGGFGWLSRRFGLACDHLAAAEVVTASGERLTVDERRHPDLFWALRGGGGGFAAVTSFRFRLRPVGPEVQAGLVVHRGEAALDAAARYRELADAAPETLGSFFLLRLAPPAPFLPQAVHGQPVAGLVVCHHGEPAAAGRDLAPWRSWGTPVADVVSTRRFADFQALFDPQAPKGRRYYWRSEYVGGFDARLAAALVDCAGRITSPYSDIKVFHLGGEVARVPAGSTAAAHRDARFIVVLAAAWTEPAEDERHVAWVRDSWRAVNDLSGRGGYVNFLTADAAPELVRAAYGGVDLERLAAVKRRYDPEGLFGGAWPSA